MTEYLFMENKYNMKIEPLFGTYDKYWYPKEHGFKDYLPEHGKGKKEKHIFRGIVFNMETTTEDLKRVLPF